MATKQEIQNIKTNIEKTIQGLQTNLKEFRYENGGFVKPNTLYSIYYTLTKQEIYLTGIQNSSNSRIIRKDKPDTLFSQYSNIKTFVRQDMLREIGIVAAEEGKLVYEKSGLPVDINTVKEINNQVEGALQKNNHGLFLDHKDKVMVLLKEL